MHVTLKKPPKRTLESFFKVTANKKKCKSDPAEGEVVEPSEVTRVASDEDATVEIRSSQASVSRSSTPPLTCNEVSIFCNTCREANKQGLLKYADVAFITNGFKNWKKSSEKFRKHEASEAHKEAVMKLYCKKKGTQGVDVMISSQLASLQATRRAGLLKQITSLRFLFRQGLAIRGHTKRK